MPIITVQIDTDACITAANCVGIAPTLFQIVNEPYVELLDRGGYVQGPHYTFEASQAEMELLEEAVESCPTRAIHIAPSA